MALILAGKTLSEKADLKATAVVSASINETVITGDLTFKISSVEKITGGVAVFAQAWKAGKQIGFGKDGTVEIERFRIFNPPILIPDPTGTVIQNYTDLDGLLHVRTLREDPWGATIEVIRQLVISQGREGTNIIPGKIGNTVDTYYSAAGAASPVDGHVGKDDSNVWATTRNSLTGNSSSVTAAIIELRNLFGNGNGPSFFTLFRAFHLFDTSGIPDGDSINSATLSVYGNGSTIVGAQQKLYAVSSTPALDSTLVVADYPNVGATSFGESNNSWSTTAYNDIPLNSSGLAAISVTGITKLGIRGYYDFNNVTPDASNYNSLFYYTADQTGTTQDPMLVVNHGAASVTSSNLLLMGVG